MSNYCSHFNCPNRITIGKENDQDVVNIICPKCERLLYVSEMRKKKRSKNIKLLLTLIIVLFLSYTAYLYKNDLISFFNPTHNTEIDTKKDNVNTKKNSITNDKKDEEVKKVVVVKDKQKETIKSLIIAEDKRDFKEIKKFFSDVIIRYWDNHYIDKNELNTQYLSSWKKTSYSKNEIEKILKVDSKTYILHTKFTYFYIKKGVEKTIYSKVKFIFDSNGTISEVYGVE